MSTEGGGAAVLIFSINDPVNYYDTENPTDPNPAPGVVTAVLSADKFEVEITLAGGVMDTVVAGAQEPAVDPDPSPSVRWIEPRVVEPGEL